MKKIRIFAFGGNEVSPSGLKDEKGKAINPDIAMQWQRTKKTCEFVADIMKEHPEDTYIITHGNGPQVGNVLLRAEYSRPILSSLPLDVCGADTQGAMGYMMAQLLTNELKLRGINKIAAETITQVLVDADDPDFQNPSKFVGPAYSKDEAAGRREQNGWDVKLYKKDDKGDEIWRRVVPSPVPKAIIEVDIVDKNIEAGVIPICVGGGGVPVVEIKSENGVYTSNYDISYKSESDMKLLKGVEAVIDKDLASALLGKLLLEKAKTRGEEVEVSLTIFTGEDGAKLNYQKPDQVDLRKLTLAELEKIYFAEPCPFPAGSMGPKIKAIIEFLRFGGNIAYITKTDLFEETLKGEAGTTVVK
ncbi:MAG: carbamate kinase [Elusimicrobiota bacterium]|nr:carbamate kinase [Elusimicrobiota bacterium]